LSERAVTRKHVRLGGTKIARKLIEDAGLGPDVDGDVP
jgi:hypothetical protein